MRLANKTGIGLARYVPALVLALLVSTSLIAGPNEWRIGRPVEYQLILRNGEVLTFKTLTARIQQQIDSVGLNIAFVAFKDKMVLQLDYANDRVAQVCIRMNGRKCAVPDSCFAALNGVDLSKTILTWPGDAKRVTEADHFCVELNYWLNESELPKFAPTSICFSSDCSLVGPYEIFFKREE